MLFWLGISPGWLRVGGTIIYMLRKHFTGQGQGTDIFLFHFLLMALSTSSKAESISISPNTKAVKLVTCVTSTIFQYKPAIF